MDKKLTVYVHFTAMVEEKAWESNLCNFFNLILKQVTGQIPTFISNLDIPGIQSNEDPDTYLRSDVFVFVFNHPGRILSDEELTALKNILNRLEPENRQLIFVAQRYNRKGHEIPQMLKNYPTYDFFEINPRTLEIHDFNQNLQSEDDNQFLLKLTDLAYDILESITSAHINSSEPLRNNTIYLAEVSADQVKNRDKLKRSLLLTGYRILPNHSLITSDNYEKDVKDAIELCVLSIHMLGELYGESYRSSDYSYQELQNRYFQDVWQDQKDSNRYHSFIKRIIWMPPQLEPFDEKQIQYIKRINREINTSENTELVQSTLSDLKILIDQNIKKLTEPQESKQSIDTKDLLIIADDHELSNSYIVKETFARTQVNYQFLHTILKNNVFNQSELMKTINKFRNYIIINTKSDTGWSFSIINLLARSKGYENSVLEGHVGLFVVNPKTGFNNVTSLTIDPVVFNLDNLEQKLEQFISNVNL